MNSNLFLLTTLLGIVAYTGSGQPLITTPPQSQTNVAGATVTFSVIATDPLPLSYQWQFNSLDLASQTNTTLVLTNVQTTNAGRYIVLVTDSAGGTTSAVATLTMLVPPTISYFAPSNQSLSLGASPSFSITARGTPPLYYSLRFNDTDLPGKTNTGSFFSATLVGLSIQSTNTGFYTAVVTNLAGATTSQVAQVSVDPTFTKITSGPIANDLNFSAVAAWGDFSNDGFLDLFVCGYEQQNVFYHNDGDGMFTKSTQGDPVQDVDYHIEPAAGDYDNDGHLDLLVSAGTSAPTSRGNRLYHNNGDSTFTPVSGGGVTNLLGFFGPCAWGDYDNDGLLDFFVANHGDSTEDGGRLLLCHNNGDATFTPITSGEVVTDLSVAYGAMWADYDNDGFMDLFVVNLLNGSRNLLYHNERNGTFSRVLTNAVATDLWPGGALGAAWGDYDNDGSLDLFVTDAAGMRNRLYHNLGHGVFTNVASGPMLVPPPNSRVNGAAWGDYDNDGFLDLFVTYIGAKSSLFHNNGDGTFTQIFTGSPVDDGGPGFHCKAITWVDYDNDGFLDLFVTVSNDNFLPPMSFTTTMATQTAGSR